MSLNLVLQILGWIVSIATSVIALIKSNGATATAHAATVSAATAHAKVDTIVPVVHAAVQGGSN